MATRFTYIHYWSLEAKQSKNYLPLFFAVDVWGSVFIAAALSHYRGAAAQLPEIMRTRAPSGSVRGSTSLYRSKQRVIKHQQQQTESSSSSSGREQRRSRRSSSSHSKPSARPEAELLGQQHVDHAPPLASPSCQSEDSSFYSFETSVGPAAELVAAFAGPAKPAPATGWLGRAPSMMARERMCEGADFLQRSRAASHSRKQMIVSEESEPPSSYGRRPFSTQQQPQPQPQPRQPSTDRLASPQPPPARSSLPGSPPHSPPLSPVVPSLKLVVRSTRPEKPRPGLRSQYSWRSWTALKAKEASVQQAQEAAVARALAKQRKVEVTLRQQAEAEAAALMGQDQDDDDDGEEEAEEEEEEGRPHRAGGGGDGDGGDDGAAAAAPSDEDDGADAASLVDAEALYAAGRGARASASEVFVGPGVEKGSALREAEQQQRPPQQPQPQPPTQDGFGWFGFLIPAEGPNEQGRPAPSDVGGSVDSSLGFTPAGKSIPQTEETVEQGHASALGAPPSKQFQHAEDPLPALDPGVHFSAATLYDGYSGRSPSRHAGNSPAASATRLVGGLSGRLVMRHSARLAAAVAATGTVCGASVCDAGSGRDGTESGRPSGYSGRGTNRTAGSSMNSTRSSWNKTARDRTARSARSSRSPTGRYHPNPEVRVERRQVDPHTNIDYISSTARRGAPDNDLKSKAGPGLLASQAFFESLREYPNREPSPRWAEGQVVVGEPLFGGNTSSRARWACEPGSGGRASGRSIRSSRSCVSTSFNGVEHIEANLRMRLGIQAAEMEWADKQVHQQWVDESNLSVRRHADSYQERAIAASQTPHTLHASELNAFNRRLDQSIARRVAHRSSASQNIHSWAQSMVGRSKRRQHASSSSGADEPGTEAQGGEDGGRGASAPASSGVRGGGDQRGVAATEDRQAAACAGWKPSTTSEPATAERAKSFLIASLAKLSGIAEITHDLALGSELGFDVPERRELLDHVQREINVALLDAKAVQKAETVSELIAAVHEEVESARRDHDERKYRRLFAKAPAADEERGGGGGGGAGGEEGGGPVPAVAAKSVSPAATELSTIEEFDEVQPVEHLAEVSVLNDVRRWARADSSDPSMVSTLGGSLPPAAVQVL
jgi:hypothetical protein